MARINTKSIICAVGAAALATPALADIRMAPTIFWVIAENDAGIGVQTFDFSEGNFINDGDEYTWGTGQWDIVDGDSGAVVASLDTASISVTQHTVTNNFTVSSLFADTEFTIISALLSFDEINAIDAQARASASINITDGDGTGATLTGSYAGGAAHEARYNIADSDEGIFAQILTNPLSAPFLASDSDSEETSPDGTFLPVGANIRSIESEFKFTLSAFDSAAGNSVFVVTPAPATAATLGMLAFGLTRRRR